MGEENQNNNSTSNEQTTKFNVSSGESMKNKGTKKTGLLVIAILLIIAIVAGLIYYFTIYTKPDQMYKRLVGNTIDSYTAEMKSMDYKTSKTSFKIDAEIDTDKIDKNVTDLINKINIGMDVQTNNEDKQFVMNVKADYEQEDLLDLQMYSNVGEEKTYMQFKNFLEKYIEVEDLDDEFYTYIEEILEKQKMSNGEKQSLQKAMDILEKELTNAIKREYCMAQKEDITVNGKTVATTKNTIKMDAKQLKDEFTTIFTNLKNNEEFINYFKEPDEVTDALESLIEQAEELDEDDKTIIEVSIYTKGIMQQAEKMEVTIYSEESEEAITMTFTKTEKDAYEFEMTEKNNTLCKGTIKVEEKSKEEGTVHLEIEVENFGQLKLNIEYSQKFNQDIDEVDIKDAVKSNELTNSDQQELMTNLQKSKLYELITSFSGGNTPNLIGDGTKSQPTTDLLDEDDDNDNDNNSDDQDREDEEDINTKENEIISYDDQQKIIFKIPVGYKLVDASDDYKSFEKGDTSITISTSYGNKDQYYKDLQEKKKYYEEDSYYNNVTLSEMNTIEVKGKTFYRATFSYQYADEEEATKNETTYVWSEISNQSVVDFEIQNPNTISSQELEEILTIEIQKK